MEQDIKQIGFGGGCHWCTEAVFASLKGVQKIKQGWIASQFPSDAFSEAVIVTYNSLLITLRDLIEIHLHTHASTSQHSMRKKYRSAVYFFDAKDEVKSKQIVSALGADFNEPIITQVLPFVAFKDSLPRHQNYYYSNPAKPFCKLYIDPKLQLLRKKFSKLMDDGK